MKRKKIPPAQHAAVGLALPLLPSLPWTLNECICICCRVCARYTGHAQVTLNGVTLTTSPLGNFDSTLVCHDYSYLPSGLLPISVQYASDPTDINNAFQFWIIPVKSVTEVADPVGSPSLHVAVPGYVKLRK